MSKQDRKPILVLKLEFLYNGKQIITNIVRSPHMDDKMVLDVISEFKASLEDKINGKKTD